MTDLAPQPVGADPSVRPTFSFVVPAHNEAAVLAGTVERIAAWLRAFPGSEIVVVENGSTDDTAAVAAALAARSGELGVRVVAERSRPGLGAAWRRGAEVATGAVVVHTAADLPFGFTDVEAWLARPDRPAFAIGSKAHPGSAVQRSTGRTAMSLVFRSVRWAFLGMHVGDTQGTLLVERSLVQRLVPMAVEDRYLYGTELVALAHEAGAEIVELPVTLEPDLRPSTVRPVRDGLRMLAGLLGLQARLARSRGERARAQLAALSAPPSWWERACRQGGTARAAAALALAAAAVLAASIAVPALLAVAAARSPAAAFVVATVGFVALVVWVLGRSRRGRMPLDGRSAPAEVVSQPSGATRWLEAAVVGLVVLSMMRPVLGSLTTSILGGRDNAYWSWQGWRLAELVRSGTLVPWHIPDVIWPYGSDLRFADGTLPSLVGLILALVLPSAALAFNASVALALTTNLLAARHLASCFSPSRAVTLVCGIAFATAPVLAVRAEEHYNLLFAAPAVLLIAAAVRVGRGESGVRPVTHGALLAACYLSSGYYAVFGMAAFALVVLAWRGVDRRLVASCAAVAGVAGLLLSPVLVLKLQHERREADAGAVALSQTAAMFGADPVAVVQPPPGTALPGPFLDRDRYQRNLPETTAFLGIPLLAGLGVLALVRSPARRPLAGSAVVLGVLAWGPALRVGGWVPAEQAWLPAQLLLGLPGTAGLRAPIRALFVVAVLATAALAAVLELVRRRARPQVTAVLCAAVVAGSLAGVRDAPVSPLVPAAPAVRTALAVLAERPVAPVVLVLPDDCEDASRLVTLQLVALLPMVGCQGFSASVPFAAELDTYRSSSAWAALRCQPERLGTVIDLSRAGLEPSIAAARALPAELGVDVVVLDRAADCAEPSRLGASIAAVMAAGKVLADDGRFVVVDLTS